MNALTVPSPLVAPVRQRPPRGGRQAAALMLGLFFLPWVVTALLFLVPWTPSAQPRGERLPAAHPRLTIPSTADTPRWRLVQVPEASCRAACALAAADAARRAHVALYKQMPRVERLWLGTGADHATLVARFPDLHARVPPADWVDVAPGLYVVDPEGRALLRYGPPLDATTLRDLLYDLNRLLKYSWLG